MSLNNEILHVFIGYESREDTAYQVLKHSILKHTSIPVAIHGLNQPALRQAGLYWRTWRAEGPQKIDNVDNKPFSTDFSFSRFLVPALMQWEGWGLFIDCDMLFRTDIGDLFDERDPGKAVQVCKQDFVIGDAIKMDGMRQEKYYRKNWSSVMLFNCGHINNRFLTPEAVNGEPGAWLHSLSWLPDHEIGELSPGWNWIDGTTKGEALNVHYTERAPWFGHTGVPYGDEWEEAAEEIGLWGITGKRSAA
jgi:hypothetical protein